METNKLKPCPFCGGEAEVTKWTEGWFVECKAHRCGGTIGAYKTEAEAIEAWNTRAVRTCVKVIRDEMEGYVFCSNCGAEIGEYGVPNYCHNCGAKVVQQ